MILEILRWTSLVAIALVAFAMIIAPGVVWGTTDRLWPLWTYILVVPLVIGAVFLCMGLAHSYWPKATGGAEHCGEGTHYVTYQHTTYVLSGKVLVPVTVTDWECIANVVSTR